MGGSLAHLRFGGKPAAFPLWKMKVVAHMVAHSMYEVVESPLAATDKETRKMLSARAGDVFGDSDAEDDEEQEDATAAAPSTSSSSSSSSALSPTNEEKKKDAAVKSTSLKKKSKALTAKQQALMKKEVAARVQQSKKAYSFLLNCLADAQAQLVVNVTVGDAHAVWKILLAQYERRSTASKHLTRTKLLHSKMERAEKFDTFLSRVQELALRLAQMGSPVNEEDMIHVVLEGLTPAYDTLVETMRMSSDLDLEEVAERCRDFQERRANAKEEAAHFGRIEQNDNDSNSWQRQGRGGRQNFQQQRGSPAPAQEQHQQNQSQRACYLCCKTTHVMFDCPLIPSSALKCTRCRRLGHVDAKCPARSGFGQRGGRGGFGQQRGGPSMQRGDRDFAAAAEEVEEEEEWSAFAQIVPNLSAHQEEKQPEQQAMLAPHLPLNCIWQRGPPKLRGLVVDTGATVHMSCESGIMTQLKPIAPITVRVANNQTVTLREGGDVKLRGEGKASVLLKDVVYDPSLAASLLSVVKLVDSGAEVNFRKAFAEVTRGVGAKKHIVAKIPRQGNLYVWPHEASQGKYNANLTQKQQAFNVVSVPAVVISAAAIPAAVPAIVHQGLGDFTAQRAPALPAQPAAAAAPRLPRAVLPAALPVAAAPIKPFELFHQRMFHIGRAALKAMVKNNSVLGLESLKLVPTSREMNVALECEHCEYGKGHRSAFKDKIDERYHARATMDRWHADLLTVNTADDAVLESLDGIKYASVVIDEWSGMVFLDVMKTKAETADLLIALHKRAVVQTGRPLKEFHSDGGGEYRSSKLLKHFADHGVTVTSTTVNTPQHNGRPERWNRTGGERSSCSLHRANLPASMWSLGLQGAVYVSNRSCSKGSGDPTKTAFELWTGIKPTVKHLRVFGCDVYVAVLQSERGKMDKKKVKGIFVGYEEKKRAYRCFVDGKIVVSRDCTFHEQQFTAAAALQEEITRDVDAAEENRVALQEEKHAEAAAAPAQPSRKAARAAAHRLYQPWSVESEEQQLRRTLRASAAEEAKRKEKVAQEERDAAVRAPMEAADNAVDVEEEERKAEPVAVQEEKKEKERAEQEEPVPAKRGRSKEKVSTEPVPRRATRTQPAVDYSSAFVAADARPLPLVVEPKTFEDAMRSVDRLHWVGAMQEELKSLKDHDTWSIVPLTEATAEGRRPIGCKWVFKLKLNSDGTVERYKARLVAKGFTQREGFDFFETFAPVMMYKSLRVLLCLAAVDDWEVEQLDVKTAFLNGVMDATVFMKLPPGVDAAAEGGVRGPACCRLKKALYGTKQASHVWHESIHGTLTRLGFRPCISDPCVYTKRTKTGRSIRLGLFVDDLIPSFHREDRDEWNEAKAALCSTYEMKDLGEAVWVLAMKLTRDRAARSITLTQESYIEKMMQQFGLDDAKTHDTPEEQTKLTRADEATTEQRGAMQQRPFMELVGSLLYASISTRPDIAHPVAMLCRSMQNPGPAHWIAAKRVLRYLAGTKTKGLRFSAKGQEEHSSSENPRRTDVLARSMHAAPASVARSGLCTMDAAGDPVPRPHSTPLLDAPPLSLAVVEAYCDADWAGDVDDRRSTSGGIVLLHGCAMIWLSKKQATVALSTAEAEYMAMSATLQEVKWLLQLLEEIGVDVVKPVPMLSDNQAAISLSSASAVPHARTKHIDLRHHFVRESVRAGEIAIRWVAGSEQLADVFTKGLSKQQYKKLTDRIMTSE